MAGWLPLSQVTITDPFWREMQTLLRVKVLPYQYELLCDRVPDAEPSYWLNNFRIAAGLAQGERKGMVFQDSDGYKWLEAVAYALTLERDPALERLADEAIDLIAAAQQPDGYLNTYYTVVCPGERFRNLVEGHELYCAGHLIEAAVAYAEATGKRKLLNVARGVARNLAQWFLPESGEMRGYPGHPEIELALVRLYEATGDEDALRLCRYFLNVRGVGEKTWRAVEDERGGFTPIWGHLAHFDSSYAQEHQPVRDQRQAAGHAVRAMYLYSAMADLAGLDGDAALKTACEALFEDTARRQMYVTGGIGSCAGGERFSTDYDLPNDTVYAETCASVGLMMFARRMWRLTDDAACFDVWERALNTVLAGISRDGERFFYVNPLSVNPAFIAANETLKHVEPVRPRWYGCACCPPNLARCVLSLGQSIYARDESALTVLAHIASRATGEGWSAELTREGDACALTLDAPATLLRLRDPEAYRLTCEGAEKRGGYWLIRRPGGRATYRYPLAPKLRVLRADPRIAADAGKVCVSYGPVVYCLEQTDNGADLCELALPADAAFETFVMDWMPTGTLALRATGVRRQADGWRTAYSDQPIAEAPAVLTFVPYFLWNNRGKGEMTVWVNELR